ncbi:hypothetical protein I204_06641 [Kwoniella mangroviensis CBS 8886]|uniref:uncharacterized protein n=1 Tax=Kwoniella mangroviensis CBS 8507 TaxID=1296122 RepID=UPI00080CC8B1|nr:uncharacterized protein I203_01387 [Kwoniella mangroviensis CBS 8507]OCF69526.1 hypothetical protein I203_01387 [Kwoniella mangroviensis CBS 8507]OCF72266.1 hypothetical protein I204_06641 [Kwoniella mangroviensis CBS 8886]
MTAVSLPTIPSSLDNNTLLSSMLNNPIEFSRGIHRQNVNLHNKMKVVQPGPPSPPPRFSSSSKQLVNGFSKSSSQGKEEGEVVEEDNLESRNQSDNEDEDDQKNEDKDKHVVNGTAKLPNGGSQIQLPTPETTQQPSSSTASPVKKKAPLTIYQPPTNPDDLYRRPIELTWPESILSVKKPAAGLHNPSMACYANATLQVLLHTPPVLRIAMEHEEGKCLRASQRRFCMLCQLRNMATGSHWGGRSYYAPTVHSHLKDIKKGFSRNKQEDTHEFFRFVTDALQLTALAGTKKDLPEKIKHSTWVYKVWGGRVRSRVICSRCQKPSDTFDWFLDLSLDVNRSGSKSIKNMMNGFTREDKLEGDNKYHCDNCKAKANATKSFKIQEAPPILTLHLKRFSVDYHSYSGRARANKYNGHIDYEEYLDIAPYMVDPKVGGTKYRLFGVTCHRGVELRFGHYTSYVRGPHGQWFHADDNDVSPVKREEVLKDRTAYLLSYIRVSDDHVPTPTSTPLSSARKPTANGHLSSPASAKIGEKRQRSDEGDNNVNVLKPKRSVNGLIGPVRPMSIRKGTPPEARNGILSPSQQNQDDLEIDLDLPPELPIPSSKKFGSLMTPKNTQSPSKMTTPTHTPTTPTSSLKIIHQPKPIPPGQFYGTKSPISRPHNPKPDVDDEDDEDSLNSRTPYSNSNTNSNGTMESYRGAGKKLSKKEKKALRRMGKSSFRSAGGDNPYKTGQLGTLNRNKIKKSKFDRMGRKPLS